MEFWFGIGLAALIGLLLGLLVGVAMVQPRLKKIKRRWQESATALKTSQAETDQLTKSLAQSQTELGSVRAQLSGLTQEKETSQKELTVAQNELTTLRNELATVRNSINQISQEKERLFFDLVSERASADKLRVELESLSTPQAEQHSLDS